MIKLLQGYKKAYRSFFFFFPANSLLAVWLGVMRDCWCDEDKAWSWAGESLLRSGGGGRGWEEMRGVAGTKRRDLGVVAFWCDQVLELLGALWSTKRRGVIWCERHVLVRTGDVRTIWVLWCRGVAVRRVTAVMENEEDDIRVNEKKKNQSLKN